MGSPARLNSSKEVGCLHLCCTYFMNPSFRAVPYRGRLWFPGRTTWVSLWAKVYAWSVNFRRRLDRTGIGILAYQVLRV